ncbi:MAG: apolipoprotein N-acyltransferase, partial [Polyangiaceae bacterium]
MWRGFWFGLGSNLVIFRFVPAVITRFTPLPWIVAIIALVLLAAAQGLRWIATCVFCKLLGDRGAPRWAAFPLGLYAGTFVPMVFPWNPAGGATPWPAMVQLADIVGERGVSAIMALASALLAEAWLVREEKRRAGTLAVIAIAIPIATALVGWIRIREIDALRDTAPKVSVALVQPSVGATLRWDPRAASGISSELQSLTETAEKKGADLTVWHEAAYPYVLPHASRRGPQGRASIVGGRVHGPVLAGVILRQADRDSTNSAILVQRDDSFGEPYDKMHLLWFGETVPLADVFPWLRHAFARASGLAPGDHQVLLSTGKIRASVLNCFEDILPGAGREAMSVRPNLIVNVTNDAWFHPSEESELHMRMSVMRAVEERRDMVRAVNFGTTTWVDAAGRVRARYDLPIAGVLMTEPALLDTPLTFFGRFGEWPTLIFASVLAIAALK